MQPERHLTMTLSGLAQKIRGGAPAVSGLGGCKGTLCKIRRGAAICTTHGKGGSFAATVLSLLG